MQAWRESSTYILQTTQSNPIEKKMNKDFPNVCNKFLQINYATTNEWKNFYTTGILYEEPLKLKKKGIKMHCYVEELNQHYLSNLGSMQKIQYL